MPLTDNLRGAIFMTVSMAAFVFGDACMKTVAGIMPLWQAVALRGIFTCGGLAVLGHLTGGLRLVLPWPETRLIGLRTLFEVGATVTFFLALVNMPFANLSAVMQSMPLALTLGATLLFREPLGWRRMTAIVVGFVGVLVIIRPGTDGFDGWSLMALLSVAFVVGRDLSTRRLPARVPSVTVAFWSAAAVSMLGLVLSLREPWQPVTPQAVALIMAAATFVVAGYLFVIKVMRVGDVSFTSPFRYTSLVWAVVLGALIFGEMPDGWSILGALIVVGSGLFTLYRERQLRLRGR